MSDASRFLRIAIKALIPAYVILALAVAAGFWYGRDYVDEETQRVCGVVVEAVEGQAEALIRSTERSATPRTPEQQAFRDQLVAAYRAEVARTLEDCGAEQENP